MKVWGVLCDRCKRNNATKRVENCKQCGDVPLCDECYAIHQGEIDLELSMQDYDPENDGY